MKWHRLLFITLVFSAAISAPAAAQTWAQIGTLSCQVDPNIGFVIVGHQPMNCVYTPAPANPPQGPTQSYDGALNTVGLNIGVSAGSVLAWAVFAPTAGVPAGALAGDYVGASGAVAVGLGGGANVLLGGSNRTFALQPLSIQGSVALNAVLGVSALTLRWR
ncbi:MAG TPA: DUF992 domain-containing protein [Pseudolabrys sp.]|jgi:uncharacterized protein DUF992|nr:DUF992 domain-containing protein [Pseudolabrys sp.]